MDKRKAMKDAYRARKVVGGIYRIVNVRTGYFLLQSTDDIQGTRNWMDFCRATDNCTLPALQEDWKRYGKDAFSLEEVEVLEKKEEQSTKQFREDLQVLLELWSEKFPSENRY